MELANAISAILFYYAEPMTIKRLSALLKRTEDEVRGSLPILSEKLAQAGLMLVQNGNEVTIGTAVEASALIESISKDELSKDLSKAALETLAIVLYKGPLTRGEIDYIRGVNSTFILRNLLVRGLVEKVENPADQRSYKYKATFQLLEYMGVGSIDQLPNYHEVLGQLDAFEHAREAEKNDGDKVETHDANTETGVPDVEPEGESAGDVAREMEHASDDLEIEADIFEEDEAGDAYDDEELREHTESDRVA